MARPQSKSQPTWVDVKAKLAAFDRASLLELIHHLYSAHKDNQAFLHARFGLGQDVLEPYRETIDRWLWPDVFRNQDTSISKAKRAISDYRKAVGDPEGLTELMVFYCERAAGFCNDIAQQDETYFDALVHMFEQALKLVKHTAGEWPGWSDHPVRPGAGNQPCFWLRRWRCHGLSPREVHAAFPLTGSRTPARVRCVPHELQT
jgi:hypothetical protein